MNPLVVLTAVFAAALAAPSEYATAGVVAAHGAHVVAPAVLGPVPAPYITAQQGPASTTLHKPAPIVSKQVHFGQTQFVSGRKVDILKPATPVLPIQAPQVLLGTYSQNAPIVKTVKETHQVNEPVYVDQPYHVPFDVPVVREQIREVPVAVHVDRPFPVAHHVAVQGETLIQHRQTAPVVQRTHTNIHAAPAVQAVGYAGYGQGQLVNAGLGYGQGQLVNAGYGQGQLVNAGLGYAQANLGYSNLGYAQAPIAAEY